LADLAREKGRTERYLPKSAWASLTPAERRATDEKKKQATTGNKPVNTQVSNTEAARRARQKASQYIKNRSSAEKK
jgi:hypothetical protein